MNKRIKNHFDNLETTFLLAHIFLFNFNPDRKSD